MSTLIGGILAHKLILAIALSTLAASGGTYAAVYWSNSGTTIGQVSFSVSAPVYVISMANLNLGSLSPGQSVTMATTAEVNLTSSGNYTVFLSNTYLLDQVFSNFQVNVTGLATSPVVLSLTSQQETIELSSGVYTVGVNVTAAVSSYFGHSITVTNLSFLEMKYGYIVYPMSQSPQANDQVGNNNK